MALDADSKIFVVYVAIREEEEMLVYFEQQAQIKAEAHINTQGQSVAQVEALLFDQAFIEVPAEYSNYSNVFSAKNTVELPENTRMNEYVIKLEKDK